ncbi:ribonuclease T2 [Hasllibacter halocynthiae]|uniref:Ribonuclease T2 n=1 Tax=Hasllibacter halocynthiae TaxID=595589 RepID=A0A2T0X402_9RHOB|nr:ribonuclease T2 [Hasllibacter halocynthiae]PRY93672.1 ribonuclease T2 [Hasllibacter halocynthiae]
MIRALLCLLALTGAARAEDGRSGVFDYYVLSLSWSPTWCALEGDGRGAPQCGQPFGWVLHGLWPQNEIGWPSDCPTTERDPTRAEAAAMADVTGTSGLARHQWRKHGRCSGLPPADYFALSRLALGRIERPDLLERLERPVEVPAAVIEEAFLEANPGLWADAITVTCRRGRIHEARICLTREMEFRRCGADVIRDCELEDALLDPVRR